MEKTTTPDQAAEWTWDIARLFPAQGTWSEEEYLKLETNHLVEFPHGYLEILSMHSYRHQRLVRTLFKLLDAYVVAHGLGMVVFAPMRVQLWPGKYREPDLLFMQADHEHRITEQYWIGADLVMEVVSPDDRQRDLETKRHEYAQAGIPEYWIVDPKMHTIRVLVLVGTTYQEHGRFHTGTRATSALLDGFDVDVDVDHVFADIDAV